MARKPLTKEQIAERTKKAKATREAKKRASMKDMGLDTIEVKKKRLSPRKSSSGSSVHESIRHLSDSDCFAPLKVRGWINNTQDRILSMKNLKDSKDSKERLAYINEKVYVDNLNSYLRSGVYTDNRWGPDRENKVTLVCCVMAYYADGTPKRNIGVWYPDIGAVYTKEMEEE